MTDQFADYRKKIEETLASLIPESSPFSPSLYEGGRYALLAPGKRIRPLLTLCTAEMLKEGSHNEALLPAAALELVHTYSLIHDDLPCMDDDDFRRGRPTLHRVYTEGHAVLMGDYLLTYAFEVITNAAALDDRQKVALVHTLAMAGGGEGMIGGQVMDIENSEHIACMHARKTGALFRAAVEFGGIVANCPSETTPLLRSFGLHFGTLFQMVDDLLDKDHPLGQEEAETAALAHFHASLKILERLPGNTTSLKKLTELVFAAKDECTHT